MASHGTKGLVALESIAIKMADTNTTTQTLGQEPEVDVGDKVI